MNIVFIVHYFPPMNSAGSRRVVSLTKYFAKFGDDITVITTSKFESVGVMTEIYPSGIRVIEINWLGMVKSSKINSHIVSEPLFTTGRSWYRTFKDVVFSLFGQILDPRLPFAFAILSPWLSNSAKLALNKADIVIGSTPPWPTLLAALFAKLRFGKKCVFDYRDQFSRCHEMPGSKFAKYIEDFLDRTITKYADHLVVISEPMASYYTSMNNNVSVVYNGFDNDLFCNARSSLSAGSRDNILIRYMGIISPGRIPREILNALTKLKLEHYNLFRRLRFEFFGNSDLLEMEVNSKYQMIKEIFYFFPGISYSNSLQYMVESDYLLFSETSSKTSLSEQGILPTKLFEYIGSGRPVLANISRETLAGDLLVRYCLNSIVSDDSNVFLKVLSCDEFYIHKKSSLHIGIHPLSREAQSVVYRKLLEDLVIFH